MKTVPFAPLGPEAYRDIVQRALSEDIGEGDVTTAATVGGDQRGRGILLAKASCILAGMDVAAEAFRQMDPSVTIAVLRHDGASCARGDVVAEVTGPAASLLTAERTALNLLQRMSGIATLTRRFVDAAGGRITILDTRKTTPMLRVLERYAVRAGGGTNHRRGLDDAMLVKDNHIRLAGGVAEAVNRARNSRPGWAIEIEAQSLEQVDAAVLAGADIILLDNLPTDEIREAIRRIAGRARVEISGGVTLERIAELAGTGADYVSVGALTHSAPAADLSFELEPDV